MKVHVLQILVTQAALFGIGLLWFNFNQTVFQTARDLLEKTFNENVDPETYPAEEFGYESE